MAQRRSTAGKLHLELADMKRNPYLADYDRARGGSRTVESGYRKISGETGRVRPETVGEEDRRRQERRGYTVVQGGKSLSARDRARLRKVRAQRRLVLSGGIACILLIILLSLRIWGNTNSVEAAGNFSENVGDFFGNLGEERIQGLRASVFNSHPEWTENFLTVNEYSRPGEALPRVDSIFVHYTANRGTSAAQNRSYFENLKDNHERSASAHFIIGYEGEIIQCIPLDEIAYAVQTRNYDSISIECCYLANDGSFTKETYNSLVELLKWLKDTYGLDTEDILRHYDCGGKKCPLYYSENPDEWEQLLQDVDSL